MKGKLPRVGASKAFLNLNNLGRGGVCSFIKTTYWSVCARVLGWTLPVAVREWNCGKTKGPRMNGLLAGEYIYELRSGPDEW